MGPANANKHYILHFSQFPSDADPPDLETILGEMLLSGRSENASEVAQSCPTLYDPMDSSLHQAPPSMGFSRQEYWGGLPFPSPGHLPNPGIQPRSPAL